ncbi:hypothetical protein [African swine fever virus]
MTKLAQWMFEQYVKDLNLKNRGSPSFRKWLTLQPSLLRYSGVMRANAFDILKYGYPMQQSGYTVATLEIHFKNIRSSFANIYWNRDSEEPEYVCCCATYQSHDGEYRYRFVWYQPFIEAYNAIEAALDPLETIILNLIAARDLDFVVHIFPYNKGHEDYLASTQLILKIFIATLLMDILRIKDNTLDVHLNSDYIIVMERLWPHIKDAIEHFFEAHKDLLGYLIAFRNGGNFAGSLRPSCGQKIVPLTIREVLQMNDINLAVWREVFIMQECSDLVINGIAPCFPIFNTWTYLQGINQIFFENTSLQEKFKKDFIARELSKEIIKGQKTLNDKEFKKLSLHQIQYMESFLLMSDVAIMITTEYVGYTLQSLPGIISRSSYLSPIVKNILMDEDSFMSLLFDLCYGAYVLHKKENVIHADLHLNNMTYYHFNPTSFTDRNKPGKYTLKVKNPVIAFITGPKVETETYVFKHIDGFGCIIDFSRAIMGPNHAIKLERQYGLAFVNTFYRNQSEHILKVLRYYFPEMLTNRENEIQGVILSNFNFFFNSITAIDFYAIARNLRSMLSLDYLHTSEVKRNVEISQTFLDTCQFLEEKAVEFLFKNLHTVLSGKPVEKTAGDVLLPIIFKKFLYPNIPKNILRSFTVIDVYNYNNIKRYSGKAIQTFPPWAQTKEILTHAEGRTFEDIFPRGELVFKKAYAENNHLDKILQRIREQLANENL